jgi:hypothetical protein
MATNVTPATSGCKDLFDDDNAWSYNTFVLIATVIQFILIVVIIVHARWQIRRVQEDAEKGVMTNDADSPLIFGVYVSLLWGCCFSELVQGTILYFTSFSDFADNSWGTLYPTPCVCV